MEKKPKPIIPFVQRKIIVEAIGCINYVVEQTEWNPLTNCQRFNPDILFESDIQKDQPANEYMINHGKKVIQIPYMHEISSTMIKERIYEVLNHRKRKV